MSRITVHGASGGAAHSAVGGSRVGRDRRAHDGLFEAPHGPVSGRLAGSLAALRPLVAFLVVLAGAYVLVAALAVAVGLLLTDVLLPVHAIGHSDEAVNDWLAAHRGGTLNDATYVGSGIGDIPAIPGLVAITAVIAALRRRWHVVALVLGAILVEVATYRVTSLLVHRERPTVVRLDQLPVNQSYPSGHVAASVAVYVALALLLSTHVRAGGARTALWALAALLPLVVAFSRMYRGMHHPIDVTAGACVGVLSILTALLATRVAVAVAGRRSTSAISSRGATGELS